MRAIAAYKDRVRTIFCTNCGGVAIAGLPIKEAEKIAMKMRNGLAIACKDCGPIMSDIREIEKTLERKTLGAHEQVRVIEGNLAEDRAVLNAEAELRRGRLETIKRERACSLDWQAKNN